MDSTAQTETNMEILPFSINYLPKFVLRKCEEECKETPERKINSIQELRSLLLSNQITSGLDFHDDVLLQYLRRNKYKIDQCIQQIQNFVLLKIRDSHMFERLPDEYLSLSCLAKIVTVLPKRCPDGCTVILTQIGKWDPKVLPFPHFKQLLIMFFLQLLRDPLAQINGFITIHDVQGMSTRHLKYCTPQNVYLLYHGSINCLPARYKAVHVIHESLPMKIIWTLVKPFLSEKMNNRVHFHSNGEELLDIFPSSIIPTKYGGKLQESFDIKNFLRNASKEHERYTIEGRPNIY